MRCGVGLFGGEEGIITWIFASKKAIFVRLLRLLPQHDDNFPFHVQPFKVIVLQIRFLGGNFHTQRHEFAIELSIRANR